MVFGKLTERKGLGRFIPMTELRLRSLHDVSSELDVGKYLLLYKGPDELGRVGIARIALGDG